MDLEDTSFLLCDEDHNFLMDNINDNSLNQQDLNSNVENIEYLFTRETEFHSFNYYSKSTTCHVHFNHTRINAIDTIFKTREKLGFKLSTAYLSVTYFDQFLVKQPIHEDRPIQEFYVACMSLAAKMMEERDLQLLFKYTTETDEEQGFADKKSIWEMEVEVLSSLEWELTTVTPFDFLHYFVYLFCPESLPDPLISQAVQHIVDILKDVNLMDHRPSAIALAAILTVAFDGTLTREIIDLQIAEISQQLNLDIEGVFSCYCLMQEKSTEKGKLNTPATTLTAQWSYTSVLDHSSVTSSKAKRKLCYDNKENCPRKISHRR